MADRKILLSESDLPRQWYNVQADLPKPMAPPLHPGTRQPIGPEALAPIFPMELIKQEVTPERWIEMPDPVREAYMIWRPSPLRRAIGLEKFLKTPARIYYKDESVSPAGSHKPNTAVPQAYYNKQAGVKRLSTETGAGQWGSALSFATNIFGLECKVYMVKASYNQKPYRRLLMEVWGASVVASPSRDTEAGRRFLAEDADTPGSLGMAISEAVEDAAKRDDTKYALGSVLNHVLLHQTVIGLEAEKQLKLVDEKQPDVVIGCVGGGSNFAGIAFPFMPMKFKGKDIKFLAVEPLACPTVSRGMFRYDFGDTAQMTPPAEDVHAGPHLCASRDSRRWTAISWDGAAREPPVRSGRHRAESVPSESGLRGGRNVRPHRRHGLRSRDRSRHPLRYRRSHPLPRGEEGGLHPLQLQRPWLLRSRRVRQIFFQGPCGLRVSR